MCRESPKNSIEIVLIQAVKMEKEAKRAVKKLYGARSGPTIHSIFLSCFAYSSNQSFNQLRETARFSNLLVTV